MQIIGKMKEYATVIENHGQIIECDVCIFSSITQAKHQINAHKYIQVVHTDLTAWDVKYTPNNIDAHVAVGKSAADTLRRDFGIEAEVIPNLLPTKHNHALRFMTASRISQGKGFERMIELVDTFVRAGKRFIWEVYGSGAEVYMRKMKARFHHSPQVIFMGEVLFASDFMRSVDYLVQLSDSEGFCYSMYEALQVGTPVIVTRWKGVEEIIWDGENGYVLDMDLKNLDVEKIFNHIPNSVKGYYNQDIIKTKWNKIL